MKKLENSFVVSGFVSVDAEIRQFDSASVARFPISISKPEKNGENTTYVSAFANIEAWRREMSLRRTKKDRPDLFAKFEPQDKRDRKILEKIRQDG